MKWTVNVHFREIYYAKITTSGQFREMILAHKYNLHSRGYRVIDNNLDRDLLQLLEMQLLDLDLPHNQLPLGWTSSHVIV